ncbi:iron-containing alcohol dehydrogenase [Pseudomonadota bacterium]
MSKVITGNWNYPTHVTFGPGAIKGLDAACRQLGMSRPLLVTDEGLKDLPMVRDAMNAVQGAGLYADVKGNPVGANVDGGVQAYRDGDFDGVIAFGGGSALDVGKAIALMVGQDRPLWDFEDVGDNWIRVKTEGLAPVVAVPTTAGTGSEVGRASVITTDDTHEKKIIFHPTMMPAHVISDPELTVGLPPHITAATGVDAFVHGFEALCAPGYHPMADGIAMEAMRLIAHALPRAYTNGGDIEARADMLAAASMGATAFQKGLGGVHALAHALGGMYDVHHGLANAVLLPYVMVANRDAIGNETERLARALALTDPGFDAVLNWVLDFREQLAIPRALDALNLNADEAATVGQRAAADPSAGGNPVAFDAVDYEDIYRRALRGDLTG